GHVVDTAVRIAEFGEACGHGGDGALARIDVADLVPTHGGGHRRLGYAANRVSRHDRMIPRILVVVDEDRTRIAVAAPPFRGHRTWRTPLHLECERLCCT